MNTVVDASAAVAFLIDEGAIGRWAETLMTRELFAPELLLVEAASSLRRLEQQRRLPAKAIAAAHADLLRMPVTLVSHEPLAARGWALRRNVSSYDACYVALAEILGCPLATVDRRLARASGPGCEFLLPPR